jgi:glycosyltransferase involved in cell wall biosynthesis
MKRCQPDLTLTYGWGGTDAIAAARLAGLRSIVHAEDGFLDDEVDQQKKRRQWARRLAFKAARSVVVPSLALCGVARRTWRLKAPRLRYIPNGIDVERFHPASSDERRLSRRSLGLEDHDVVVGIVGALRPEKNQLRLLRSFADVSHGRPEARLLIVGDGPLLGPLRSLAQERGITDKVIFSGQAADPAPLYRAMDILALSSDTEQMPLSVLEGMASALPVVSTDVGDVKEMVAVSNRTFVVARGDDALYGRSLSALIESPSMRATLGLENRQRCEAAFKWSQMLQAYIDLYEEFVGNN